MQYNAFSSNHKNFILDITARHPTSGLPYILVNLLKGEVCYGYGYVSFKSGVIYFHLPL
jgi:hypothetical protein